MTAIYQQQFSIDLSKVEANTSYSLLAPGEYSTYVKECAVKESKNGKPMVSIQLEVFGCDRAGAILFDNFVLNNDIALSRLKSLAVATGHPNPNYIDDVNYFNGKEIHVKVKIKTDDTYGEKNVISSYIVPKHKSTNSVMPPPAANAQAVVPANSQKPIGQTVGSTPWQPQGSY